MPLKAELRDFIAHNCIVFLPYIAVDMDDSTKYEDL